MSNARSLAFDTTNSGANNLLQTILTGYFSSHCCRKETEIHPFQDWFDLYYPPRSYYLESAEFAAVSRQRICFYSEKFK